MCAEKHRCLQPVHAVRQAVNSRRSDPDREGPPTECAASIPRNDQAVQVGWSSMSTVNPSTPDIIAIIISICCVILRKSGKRRVMI